MQTLSLYSGKLCNEAQGYSVPISLALPVPKAACSGWWHGYVLKHRIRRNIVLGFRPDLRCPPGPLALKTLQAQRRLAHFVALHGPPVTSGEGGAAVADAGSATEDPHKPTMYRHDHIFYTVMICIGVVGVFF